MLKVAIKCFEKTRKEKKKEKSHCFGYNIL